MRCEVFSVSYSRGRGGVVLDTHEGYLNKRERLERGGKPASDSRKLPSRTETKAEKNVVCCIRANGEQHGAARHTAMHFNTQQMRRDHPLHDQAMMLKAGKLLSRHLLVKLPDQRKPQKSTQHTATRIKKTDGQER